MCGCVLFCLYISLSTHTKSVCIYIYTVCICILKKTGKQKETEAGLMARCVCLTRQKLTDAVTLFVGRVSLQVCGTWLEEPLFRNRLTLAVVRTTSVFQLCWDSIQSCIFANVVGLYVG